MNYTPFNPEWTYTKIEIENIKQINKELVDLFWKQYDPESNVAFIGFQGEDPANQWNQLPTLKRWLEEKDLLRGRWMTYFYSITHKKDFPIHIDYSCEDRSIAFNFPLINCENTYTAWYDAVVNEKTPISFNAREDGTMDVLTPEDYSEAKSNHSFWCIQETAEEIDRALCDSPMIINISIPHRPISTHNKLRVLFTLRLTPSDFKKDVQPFIDENKKDFGD